MNIKRKELDALMDKFLKGGGKITKCPTMQARMSYSERIVKLIDRQKKENLV